MEARMSLVDGRSFARAAAGVPSGVPEVPGSLDEAGNGGWEKELDVPLAGMKTMSLHFADVREHGAGFRDVVEIKAPSFRDGKPAILLSESELTALSKPFRLSLIGKFTKGRPKWVVIQKCFRDLKLLGGYKLANVDLRHFVVHLQVFEDYVRIFENRLWLISGFPVKMLKWTLDFCVDFEPSVVPIWISLPLVRFHLLNKPMLFSIASIFGKPLRMDLATSQWSRPSCARILVEMDVCRKLETEVWIGNEQYSYVQQVVFENIPSYCSYCRKLGHSDPSCFFRHPELLRKRLRRERSSGVVVVDEGLNVQSQDMLNVACDKLSLERFLLDKSFAEASIDLVSSVRGVGLENLGPGAPSAGVAFDQKDMLFNSTVGDLSMDSRRLEADQRAEVVFVGLTNSNGPFGCVDVSPQNAVLLAHDSGSNMLVQAESISAVMGTDLQMVGMETAEISAFPPDSSFPVDGVQVSGGSMIGSDPNILHSACDSDRKGTEQFLELDFLHPDKQVCLKSGPAPIGGGISTNLQCFGDSSIPVSRSEFECVAVSQHDSVLGDSEYRSKMLLNLERNSAAGMVDQQPGGLCSAVPHNAMDEPLVTAEIELMGMDDFVFGKDFTADSVDGVGVAIQPQSNLLGDDDSLSPKLHHYEDSSDYLDNTELMYEDMEIFGEDWSLQKRKGRLNELMNSSMSKHIEGPKPKRFTRSSLKEMGSVKTVGGIQPFLQRHGTDADVDEVIHLLDRVVVDKVKLDELRRHREDAAVVKEDVKRKREVKKVAATALVQDKLLGKHKQGRNRRKR